jgi:hypothetical protein
MESLGFVAFIGSPAMDGLWVRKPRRDVPTPRLELRSRT